MTIDELASTIDINIQLNLGEGSTLGYFNAFVQRLVADLTAGQAATPLAVAAVGRYVDAYEAFQAGTIELPHCWQVQFDTATIPSWRPHILPLQYLVMGVAAHLQFDLPIAAYMLCDEPRALAGHKDAFSDYSKRVLDHLSAAHQKLADFSPLQDLLESYGLVDGPKLFGFSPAVARKTAWRMAAVLTSQTDENAGSVIEDYDDLVAAQVKAIREPGESFTQALAFVRRFESDTDEAGAMALIEALQP